jgi:hypothetical protein
MSVQEARFRPRSTSLGVSGPAGAGGSAGVGRFDQDVYYHMYFTKDELAFMAAEPEHGGVMVGACVFAGR